VAYFFIGESCPSRGIFSEVFYQRVFFVPVIPTESSTHRHGSRTLFLEHGTSTELLCDAEGSPPLQYSWERNSSSLTLGGKYQLMEGGAVLVVHNVTLEDEGDYFCSVENCVGEVQLVSMLVNIGGQSLGWGLSVNIGGWSMGGRSLGWGSSVCWSI
jgi:hypothetical protein